MILYTLLMLLMIIILISTLVFYLINGIAPTPTPFCYLNVLKKNLPKNFTGDIVEAGAGWGRIAFWLAKQYPHNKIIAYENAWLPFVIFWIRLKATGSKNIKLKYGNFNNQSLNSVSLIYTYLCRKGMQNVSKWIKNNPSNNLQIISNCFALPNCKPYKTVTAGIIIVDTIYFYEATNLTNS